MRAIKITTLPSKKDCKWIDKDVLLLHSCFQILVDFVEQEKPELHFCNESNKEILNEIKFLYNWWLNRKDKDLTFLEEIEQDYEDEEMLIRLMKIRLHLWT